jgi:hypothetical protein
MNPLTQHEASRILAVVDELTDDHSVVSTLPPYLSAVPAKDMQHLLDAFHDEEGVREVQQQLTEHYDLERRLESATGDMTADDVDDLHFSTRALVDTMRFAGYPTQYKPTFAPSQQIGNYQDVISTLRTLLNNRLTTTVEDDVIKFAILNDTVNRERTATADVQALKREHTNEKDSRRFEVEKRNVLIRKLKEEWSSVKESAVSERSQFEKVSVEQEQSDEQTNVRDFEELLHKVEVLEAELKAVELKCGNDETSQRQARSKKETALSQIIQHYDNEMSSSKAVIVGLRGEIDKDKEEFGKLDVELTKYGSEADAYAAEMHLEEQRKTHSIVIGTKQQEHCRTIQAFFRSHAVRLHVAQAGKKKKKGGKKK